MKVKVHHDGSVSITIREEEHYLFLSRLERFFVNEFEIIDGEVINYGSRPLR